MPPPRASRLAARKSLGVNMHDFQVESSPEPQPTASTSAVAPPTAPLPRRSGRTSLEANATLDLPKPPSKQTAKPNTKPKAPSATQKRKSLLNNKRLRSEPEQDSADDEGEEESSFLDASKSHLNPKFPAPPPPIKSALKAANPEKKSRGVAPRAAKILNKAPPVYSHHLADQSNDSDTTFAFSTHPPTPGATLAASSKKGKRRADPNESNETRPTKTSRTTTMRQPSVSSPPLNPQSTPGKISARRAGPPSQFDPKTDNSAPINTRETPIGMRNIAMRNGESAGKSGSARRDSIDRRGKRGSSIGNGFTAVPHPDVPSDKLYRTTDATAPPAIRLRSLISWTAQRQRDLLFPPELYNSTAPLPLPRNSRSKDKGPSEATKRFAKSVVEDFISGICSKSIDVSWISTEVDEDEANSNPLPPHPQNIVNAAKMTELGANYDAIEKEDLQRAEVLEKYTAFEEARAQSIMKAASTPTFDPSSINFAVPLPAKVGMSLDEVLSFGKTLIAGEEGEVAGAKPKGRKSATKGKGKARASTVVIDDLEASLAAVRLQTANFQLLTHRITQYASQSSTYIASRLHESHARLTQAAAEGLNTIPASELYERNRLGKGPLAEVVRVATGRSVEENGAMGTAGRGGLEARDLIRGIAFCDGRKK